MQSLIIWQAPRAGSMRRILCSDWLSERARWSDTARPGLPVSFPQIKFHQFKVQASARKFSFAEMIIFCFLCLYGTRKSVNENENKENKNIDEFYKYVLQQKPANTKVCFEFENLNLKYNQSNDCIFCIYPIRI